MLANGNDQSTFDFVRRAKFNAERKVTEYEMKVSLY